jgi:hypothetical protein
MATTTHIQVRDARDRLLEVLHIGYPYPLCDLTVRDEQLTVAFNTPAKIPIENSQVGVLYQLHDKDHRLIERVEAGLNRPVEAPGNGGRLELVTPPITEDITFSILAKKLASGKSAYLQQTATVKVGLDTALAAWIRDVPLLASASIPPSPTAPRLIHYGDSVAVEIENSQESIDYRLVADASAEAGQESEEVVVSVADVRGDLHNIVLHTQPLYEDVDIRIRATKTFDPSENRPLQTSLLDAVLPVKVRANAMLPVSVDVPIADIQQPVIITVSDTQPSAQYRLHMRAIQDRDFVRQTAEDAEVVKVSVEGKADVQVRKPEHGDVWVTPEGYRAISEWQAGSGGDLQFQIDGVVDDSLVIVQAQKVHQAAQEVRSAVQLDRAAVILVRPELAPPLRLRVPIEGAVTRGTVQIFDGQPGVFYYLRLEPDGPNLGLPAYFHQRDASDPQVNKGLGQLHVEVDFVMVSALSPAALEGPGGLAEARPDPPLLEIGAWPTGSTLSIRAVKAQTGIEVSLPQTVSIATLPQVKPRQAVIEANTSTDIVVSGSRKTETYQLQREGQPLGDALAGNGKTLALPTGILQEDTAFELLVTRPADQGLAVERVLRLQVAVQSAT